MALLNLEKFDEEPEAEDESEKETDELAAGEEEGAIETEPPKEKKDGEVEESFVELHGMAWDGRTPVCWVAKNDRPREGGRGTENFLVDEIADPYAKGSKSGRDADKVEKANPGQLRL